MKIECNQDGWVSTLCTCSNYEAVVVNVIAFYSDDLSSNPTNQRFT